MCQLSLVGFDIETEAEESRNPQSQRSAQAHSSTYALEIAMADDDEVFKQMLPA